MSIVRVRNRAEHLLERLGIQSLPVNVHYIARQLGIRIVQAHLGNGVSGLLVNRSGTPIICVQESDPETRKRFTIAHELGHHYLGHAFERGTQVHVDRGNLVSFRNSRSSDGIDPKEIEANQFAASLLMPSGLLKMRAAEVAQGPLLDSHLSRLAEDFAVSEQAMTIRLMTIEIV